jgi:hypothetical protein
LPVRAIQSLHIMSNRWTSVNVVKGEKYPPALSASSG